MTQYQKDCKKEKEVERTGKESVCVCNYFPPGSFGPAAAILICRWNEGWEERTEEESEAQREGGCNHSLEELAGLLDIAQSTVEGREGVQWTDE